MTDGMRQLSEAIGRLHGHTQVLAIGALGGLGAAYRERMEHQQRLERAVARLMMLTHRLDDRDPLLAEVEHRTALMGEAAAYESVYDDVVQGRWPR
jgi:hypothetical protein